MPVTDPTALTNAPFITPSQLRGYLKLDISELPDATANELIAGASGAIRDYCGWPITRETRTVDAIPIGGQDWYLPTKFLVSVAEFRVGNDPGDGSNVVNASRYQWTSDGILLIAEGFILPHSHFETYGAPYNDPYFTLNGWLLPLIEADIVDGYENVPAGIASACKMIAALASSNPAGIQSETVGLVSERYGTKSVASGFGISDEAKILLQPYVLVNTP